MSAIQQVISSFAPSGGGGASLLTGLVEWWDLGEASGDRFGSFAGLTMFENGVVGTASGVGGVGVAAKFNSTWLERPSSAAVEFGDEDFSIAGWIKLTTYGTINAILNKWGDAAPTEFISCYFGPFNLFAFLIGPTSEVVTASTFGTPSLGVWYFVYCEHDSVNNRIRISINNGSLDSVSYSGGVTANPLNLLKMGKGDTHLSDQAQQFTGLWRRCLTGAEISALYGSGTPLSYPF